MDNIGDHQEVLIRFLGSYPYRSTTIWSDLLRVSRHVDGIGRISAIDEASKSCGIGRHHILVDDMALGRIWFGKEIEFAEEGFARVVLNELVSGAREVRDADQQHERKCKAHHLEVNCNECVCLEGVNCDALQERC
jgi:hypothetical protein